MLVVLRKTKGTPTQTTGHKTQQHAVRAQKVSSHVKFKEFDWGGGQRWEGGCFLGVRDGEWEEARQSASDNSRSPLLSCPWAKRLPTKGISQLPQRIAVRIQRTYTY